MPNIIRPSISAYGYVFVAIQILRVCGFITLPSFYFGLRNDEKKYDEDDTERQALLSKKLAPNAQGSGDTATSENGYGTITETTAEESDTADKSSDDDAEDTWLAQQRKAQELIAKRLKQDGNWFTYAKGFFVSLAVSISRDMLMPFRYSFHTYGHFITRLFNSELSSLELAYSPQMLSTFLCPDKWV